MKLSKLLILFCIIAPLHELDARAKKVTEKSTATQATDAQQPMPQFFQISAPALAAASQTISAIQIEGWNPSVFSQIQWLENGILMKYLIQEAENQYLQQTIQPYQKKLDALEEDIAQLRAKPHKKNKVQLAELEQQKKELTQERDNLKNETGLYTSAAGKFVEANIKQAIEAYVSSQAPADYVSVMKSAFGSGLKFRLLSDVASPIIQIGLQEIIKQSKPASLKWDWYPYAPLTSTHSTAIYCGPKDPYCLHGAKQLDVNQTMRLIGANLSSMAQGAAVNLTTILTAYASHIMGSAIGSLPKTLGQLFSAIAQSTQTQWLVDLIQRTQPTVKSLDPLLRAIQRYAENAIPVSALQSLTNFFDDMNVNLTDEQKKNLKKQFITTSKARGLYAGSEDLVKFVANMEAAG